MVLLIIVGVVLGAIVTVSMGLIGLAKMFRRYGPRG